MALTQRLQLRQSQALVMTPQLMQAIKLLQLSNLDLAAYVEGELERNPLLERAGEGEEERTPADREVSPDAARADWMQTDRDQDQSSSPEQPAVDIEDVLPRDADAATSRANGEGPMGYSEWAGIGVLITDHNVRETLGLTDRAYIIYSGEVLMEGRADDIVNNPDVRRLYLGEEFRL